MNTAAYIDSFLKTLPSEQDDQTGFYVVGLIGLPGSGKSTFSRALSQKTGLYIASNDKIRRWLDERGIEGLGEEQALVERIAEARTKYLLQQRISHIIDADIIKFQDLVRQNVEASGARLFTFALTTPEAVILQRLQQRQGAESSEHHDQLSRAGVEEYRVRKAIHAVIGEHKAVDLTIDATADVDIEAERVSVFIAEEMEIK